MKLFIILALAAACVIAKPANEVAEIEPSFDAYRDVRLLLSTRRNRGNPYQIAFRNFDSIRNSPFDASKPTRVLVHGWWEDDTSDISVGTSEELLNYYDFNVIFVDWSEGGQTINYVAAAGRTETVGFFVASQLNWMRENNLINFDRIHVIGFSLGAHIAGFIGKNTNSQLDTVIGLDPAGPLFNERNPGGRIDAGDARYVECLHTNGGLLGLGFGAHICQADFFPNGGSSQTGCLTNTCAHLRAVSFYIEAIINNGFHAIRCQTETQASRENCASGGGQWFADPNNAANRLSGIFHFSTNRNPPFAQGPFRP
ncbi:pancreatic triacylglycerol lipase-like [Chironomus tepperi]|uniref:pancreatic triacylglycerol lipase-like n=1 Tax=Chironomus tepperi TaxID=113505 RepID=UPI00391F2BF8